MAKILKNTEKETIAWRNGTLHYFDVWLNNEVIGKGYVVSRADGDVGNPELFDLNGAKLAEGWYQLQMTEYTLCIVPKNIQ